MLHDAHAAVCMLHGLWPLASISACSTRHAPHNNLCAPNATATATVVVGLHAHIYVCMWALPMAGRRKWQVAMIGASSDFFIATTDHNEWGDAFSVWGEVRWAPLALPGSRLGGGAAAG